MNRGRRRREQKAREKRDAQLNRAMTAGATARMIQKHAEMRRPLARLRRWAKGVTTRLAASVVVWRGEREVARLERERDYLRARGVE